MSESDLSPRKPPLRIVVLLVCAALAGATQDLSAPEQGVLDRISSGNLRGNLSFLASDALEGRDTPSRGLTVAAEFIASRFRQAGLEPIAPNGSYFQTARFVRITPRLDDFRLTLRAAGEALSIPADNAEIRALTRLDLNDAPVLNLPESGRLPSIEGRVVAGSQDRYGAAPELTRLQAGHPALILLMSRHSEDIAGRTWLEDADSRQPPLIRIVNGDAVSAVEDNRALRISLHLAAPVPTDTPLQNVGAILRGSDPALRNQWIVVTAHYDHLGMKPAGPGDRIYNGANDNGSGTVSILEIASALVALPAHPKRSILFMALFGEEEGLLGARYYVRHPIVPLKDTVANINLEQMGRTDERSGARPKSFAFTGPSFSDMPAIMTAAAKQEGISVYKKADADDYFERSDNYAFALAGIVAHTLVVAFEFPDYHDVGDEWPKIDYDNMARVDRGVAAGILELADRADPPRWSKTKETAPYREVRR